MLVYIKKKTDKMRKRRPKTRATIHETMCKQRIMGNRY